MKTQERSCACRACKRIRDAAEGAKLKEEGKQRAADARSRLLSIARSKAFELASHGSAISSDDVRRAMIDCGFPDTLGNATGSLFHGKKWEPVGFKKSDIKTNRCRIIRTWRLRPGPLLPGTPECCEPKANPSR